MAKRFVVRFRLGRVPHHSPNGTRNNNENRTGIALFFNFQIVYSNVHAHSVCIHTHIYMGLFTRHSRSSLCRLTMYGIPYNIFRLPMI